MSIKAHGGRHGIAHTGKEHADMRADIYIKSVVKTQRESRLNTIIEQCRQDPQLALQVADYLDQHLEIKLEKIEGDPVTWLLKRARLEENGTN